MANVVYRFFLLHLLLLGSVYGANQPIKELKQKLVKYQASVSKVRKEMKSIGGLIKQKNKRLIDILQKKTSMQNEIIEMEHSYQKDFERFSEIKLEIKSQLKSIALNQFDENGEKGFFKNVIIRHQLKRKLSRIKKDEKKLTQLRSQILSYQKQLQELERFETDLNIKIVTLESKQNDFITTYQNRLGRTSELSNQIKAELKKQNAFFSEPFEQYAKRTSNKKGVYYTILGRQELVASKAGKVIYVGSMANYGNVVMIQHAKSKISVYLGQFSPKIKENLNVEQGDILGYTEPASKKHSNIYFEIRHKNIPQKTLPLLQKV